MTGKNQLVEQHILEYGSRLKHFDELLEQAEQGITETPKHDEIRTKLKELQQKRDELTSHFEQMKLKLDKNWEVEMIEKSGPMGIWDTLAQDLEHLLERMKL